MNISVVRSYLLAAMLQACAILAHAQSAEQWTAWGDASMARGEYYGASRFYNGALAIEPGRMSLQWKQAEACRWSHQYDKAAELYATVFRKDMGRTYPDALRWLGEMQLSAGAYDEAERTWNKVLQREKDKRSMVAQRASNALKGIARARQFNARPDTIALEHLPMPVNTYDSEFGARIGPDNALLFTSMRGSYNKEGEVEDTMEYRSRLYMSSALNGQWTEAVALKGQPTNGQLANSTWSGTGKWIFTTHCHGDSPCRIHYAPYDGRNVDVLTPLEGLGDALSTQPMVVHWQGRELLFFVSDRTGGPGGMDIWQAELRDGRATDVKPLGPPVNTPGNERTPWFDTTSATLWFSSDFLPGLGGYDIFTSPWNNGAFATPGNAGSPINSPANDLYPALYPDRGEGWLTSNRKGSFAAKGETCCNDLYRWTTERQERTAVTPPDTPEQTTEVIRRMHELSSLQARFPLKLYFHNDEPEPRSWSTTHHNRTGTPTNAIVRLSPPIWPNRPMHRPSNGSSSTMWMEDTRCYWNWRKHSIWNWNAGHPLHWRFAAMQVLWPATTTTRTFRCDGSRAFVITFVHGTVAHWPPTSTALRRTEGALPCAYSPMEKNDRPVGSVMT